MDSVGTSSQDPNGSPATSRIGATGSAAANLPIALEAITPPDTTPVRARRQPPVRPRDHHAAGWNAGRGSGRRSVAARKRCELGKAGATPRIGTAQPNSQDNGAAAATTIPRSRGCLTTRRSTASARLYFSGCYHFIRRAGRDARSACCSERFPRAGRNHFTRQRGGARQLQRPVSRRLAGGPRTVRPCVLVQGRLDLVWRNAASTAGTSGPGNRRARPLLDGSR